MSEGYNDLTGPIEIGQRFIWEPQAPHAREYITVTRIVEVEGDERRIYSRSDGNGQECWNEESRFREACLRTGVEPMSDDLVEQARDCANGLGSPKNSRGDLGLFDDLADRIEELEAKLARAVEALKAVKKDLEMRADMKGSESVELGASTNSATAAKNE